MRFRFKETGILKVKLWRQFFILGWLVNVICFFALSMYFYQRYGFMTDDINYFYGSMDFNKTNIFKLKDGTEFMLFIVRPVRQIFNLDIASFHVLFGTMGFVGSLNYLYVLSQRIDFLDSRFLRLNQLAFLIILCFPNFMLWARVFGKDSTMYFLASIFIIGAFRIFKYEKVILKNIILIIVPLYFMQIIRPHIAGVIGGAFLLAYIFKLRSLQPRHNIGLTGIVKVYLPAVLLGLAGVFIFFMMKKMVVGGDEVTIGSVKKTVMSATLMGSYGGSATDLASEIRENPDVLFEPIQILENIFNLLLAPLPWDIRGGADLVAFLSNIILVFLLYKFIRMVKLFDLVQKYLLMVALGLIILLSFMTGNVGLILRQKTIILPFLFLLIFSRPPAEDEVKTA